MTSLRLEAASNDAACTTHSEAGGHLLASMGRGYLESTPHGRFRAILRAAGAKVTDQASVAEAVRLALPSLGFANFDRALDATALVEKTVSTFEVITAPRCGGADEIWPHGFEPGILDSELIQHSARVAFGSGMNHQLDTAVRQVLAECLDGEEARELLEPHELVGLTPAINLRAMAMVCDDLAGFNWALVEAGYGLQEMRLIVDQLPGGQRHPLGRLVTSLLKLAQVAQAEAVAEAVKAAAGRTVAKAGAKKPQAKPGTRR